jgi:glycolate oxidase iron-sulfur subunit
MRAIADDRLEVTKAFGEEMYFCLGCLACQTACPAGVNYAELFEHARAEVEAQRVLSSPKRNFIRGFTVHWLFMELARLQLVGRAIRFYQQLGLQTLLRRSGVMKLFPRRLQELEAMTPEIQPQFSAEMISPVTPAVGERRYRVAMMIGCAQDLIFSDVNRDTVEVLVANGCEVVTPPEQSCCGSLHAHNGEWTLAQQLARRNIEQFPPEQFDAIITNAGGCGSHLKHYAKLLPDDDGYRKRAELWDNKVKDIHEWLIEIGIRTPADLNSRRTEESLTDSQLQAVAPRTDQRLLTSSPTNGEFIVTYHESCHLTHGQKVVKQPRELLRAIPGLQLVELPEASWCCGSAGIYNLTQPEMAGDLLERKLKHIQSTGALTVATANPGCLLQLINGAAQRGMQLRIVHPITLLAEAYRRSSQSTP